MIATIPAIEYNNIAVIVSEYSNYTIIFNKFILKTVFFGLDTICLPKL